MRLVYQLVFLFVVAVVAIPAAAHAEIIQTFEADIELSTDGSFLVTEQIEYDFDTDRHGIYRRIPLSHPQESGNWYTERYISIEPVSVTMDGTSVPYEVNRDAGELSIRIGDPDKTISGTHTYTLIYRVHGALTYYETDDVDLYWNVTGNEWDVAMEDVAVTVSGAGIRAGQADCYVGAYGANEQCEIAAATSSTTFTTSNLSAGEGLTIAQSIEPTAVERVVLERVSLLWFWLIAAVLWLVGLGVFIYRYITRHRTHSTIIAQYEPYEAFKPMYTGLLFDGRIDGKDITAGIVSLAEQGFFSIKRTDRKTLLFFETDDYEVTLRRPYDEVESRFEKRIFRLLFDTNAPVGSTVALGDLKKDTTQQSENRKTLQELKKTANEDLIDQGFFEHRWRQIASIFSGLLVTLAGLLALTHLLGADVGNVVVIALGILVGSAVLLAFTYRRRTRKGYQALDHLKGFKEYLTVTDRERFKFHNAPEKSPEQFMQYLPYAIAFGVEKEWAEVFKDISIPEPEWYDSGGHGAFSAVHLTNSLSSFGSTFTNASGTSPASSGGGFSGGGAGGGGGGSW